MKGTRKQVKTLSTVSKAQEGRDKEKEVNRQIVSHLRALQQLFQQLDRILSDGGDGRYTHPAFDGIKAELRSILEQRAGFWPELFGPDAT